MQKVRRVGQQRSKWTKEDLDVRVDVRWSMVNDRTITIQDRDLDFTLE